jgi:hypothetical protein
MITKNTTFFDVYNESGDYEGAIKELRREIPEFHVKYQATDGWRGYWKVYPKKKYSKNWKLVEDERLAGWVTGNWDDAPQGASESEFQSVLDEYDNKEVLVIFTPSSNVFATNYDIFERI